MRYSHRFLLDRPLAEVADFHRRPGNLKAITPPVPFDFIGDPPDLLETGDELTFRTWVGLVPVHWRARIEDLPGATGGGEAADEDEGSVTGGGAGARPGVGSGVGGSEVAGVPPVAGFVDRMVEGPFAAWEHRHRFVELGPHRTAVEDRIEARLRLHPVWGPVGLQMWLSLPLLFRYREKKTLRLFNGG